jgi:PAS domain S-box-containing protein
LVGLATLFTGSFLFIKAIKKRDQYAEALRESEERYKMVTSMISDYIFIVGVENDGSVKLSYVSDNYNEITGRSIEGIITPAEWMTIIHPEDLECFMRFFKEHLASDQPGEIECRSIVKPGVERWIQIFVNPKVDEKTRRPYMLVGAVKDITERKLAEEALKASLKEKEVLLKEIHHRVKNNLQIISSLLSLQIDKVKDEKLLREFHGYRNRVNTMAIIHEKLYQSESYSNIDFADYITTLVGELTSNFTLTGVPVSHEMHLDKVNLTINQAIPCGLIINEIITNSIKYAFPPGWKGDPKITIALRQDHGNNITLNISDNGIGIPHGLDSYTDTIGVSLINLLTRQINGTLHFDGMDGASYTITFMKQ